MENESTVMLDHTDKADLLKLARITLEAHFATGETPAYHTSRPTLRERQGAFVSLHCGKELRGCIGQLYADRELYKIVQHCVLSAALEDTRFPPVTALELPALTVEISVLTPFRRIRDVAEIEVGKHGLYVVRGRFRGLLLPQVATQYGWDSKTFLAHTCQKAGLPESAWQDADVIIHTFEAQVFSERDL